MSLLTDDVITACIISLKWANFSGTICCSDLVTWTWTYERIPKTAEPVPLIRHIISFEKLEIPILSTGMLVCFWWLSQNQITRKQRTNLYFSNAGLQKIFSRNRSEGFVNSVHYLRISKLFPVCWAEIAEVQFLWFITTTGTELSARPFFSHGLSDRLEFWT